MLKSLDWESKRGKIMQRNFVEKRRKRPSYAMPFLYFFLEMVLMYLTLALLNWNLILTQWSPYSFLVVVLWLLFSSAKLRIVLKRQKTHYD
jgi:hypothetical protein